MDLRMIVRPGQQVKFLRNKFPDDGHCPFTIGDSYIVIDVGTQDVTVIDDDGVRSTIHMEEFLLVKHVRNLPDWW